MADPIRIYWDSCAWIGLVNLEPDKISPLRSVWEAAQRGTYEIWTSAYAYLELQYGSTPHGEAYSPEESDLKFEELLRQPYVKRVQLDTPIGRFARKLKRDLHTQGLGKRPDAVHLATALFTNCMELHTWDRSDLLIFDNKLTCRNGKLLRIVTPGPDYLQAPLFERLEQPPVEHKDVAPDIPPTDTAAAPVLPTEASQPEGTEEADGRSSYEAANANEDNEAHDDR